MNIEPVSAYIYYVGDGMLEVGVKKGKLGSVKIIMTRPHDN